MQIKGGKIKTITIMNKNLRGFWNMNKLKHPFEGTWKPQYSKQKCQFPHLDAIDYDTKHKRYYSLYADVEFGDAELREIFNSNHPFAAKLSQYLWAKYRWSNDKTNYLGLFTVNSAADVRVKM